MQFVSSFRRFRAIVRLSGLFGLLGARALAQTFLSSPDGSLSIAIQNTGGHLTYSASFRSATVIEQSPLGVVSGTTDLGAGITLGGTSAYTTNFSFPSRSGMHPTAMEQINGLRVAVTHTGSGTGYYLHLLAASNGLAFRYEFADGITRNITREASGFVLPDSSTIWLQTVLSDYQGIYRGSNILALATNAVLGPPAVVALPGASGYLALTEANLSGFPNPYLIKASDTTGRLLSVVYPTNQDGSLGGTLSTTITNTPWNIVMVGADLNSIVNNDLVEALSPAPDPALYPNGAATGWLRMGRSVWDYLRPQPGGITPTNAMINSLWASRMGFEYNTIDEGWANWTNASGTVAPWPLVKQVTDYSHSLGVKIILWKTSSELNTQAKRTAFYQLLKANGADGFKADFFDFNSVTASAKERIVLLEAIVREAAPYQLMVNCHGISKPTGQFRTYPNLLNFEAVFGKEQWPNPWMAVSSPITRFLAGPADFTPMEFGGNIAFEIAHVVNMPGPLITFAERSDKIASSAFASLIRGIPCQWDETIVLPQTQLGATTATARRKGQEWYLGIMNAGATNLWTIPLTFLSNNIAYQADIVRQTSTGIERTNVTRGSQLQVAITTTNGSGCVAHFYPSSSFTAGTNNLLNGSVIGTSGAWGSSANTRDKVFDSSLATFFDGPDASGDWVGLDLGSTNSCFITLIRYCPRANWSTRMTGGVFQGANSADFSDAVLLGAVGFTPLEGEFSTLAVTNSKVFRYVRYLSPAGGYCNVAELQFYGTGVAGVPARLSAVSGHNRALIQWDAVANATRYRVKRSLTSGGGYLPIATGLTNQSYLDDGLTNGINYYYVVSALNALGEGGNSDEVSAKPEGYETWVTGFKPVGYWRLNEKDGNTCYDTSSHQLDGSYLSAVSLGQPGPDPFSYPGFEAGNRAAAFSGQANSWAVLPALNLTNSSLNVTFTAWICPSNAAQSGATGLVFCRDGMGTTSGLGYNPAGTQLGYTWNDDGGTYGWNSGLTPPANQWSFVALVVTPTNASLQLYNTSGPQTARIAHAHNPSAFAGPARIANDAYSPARTFSGGICEVAVFDKALNDDALATLYHAGTGLFPGLILSNQWTGSRLTLSWLGGGDLLEATNLPGPWLTNAEARSPFVISPDAGSRFYRLKTL
jgi:alpha-glucosidase